MAKANKQERNAKTNAIIRQAMNSKQVLEFDISSKLAITNATKKRYYLTFAASKAFPLGKQFCFQLNADGKTWNVQKLEVKSGKQWHDVLNGQNVPSLFDCVANARDGVYREWAQDGWEGWKTTKDANKR